jgi:hypothetical protein
MPLFFYGWYGHWLFLGYLATVYGPHILIGR